MFGWKELNKNRDIMKRTLKIYFEHQVHNECIKPAMRYRYGINNFVLSNNKLRNA